MEIHAHTYVCLLELLFKNRLSFYVCNCVSFVERWLVAVGGFGGHAYLMYI